MADTLWHLPEGNPNDVPTKIRDLGDSSYAPSQVNEGVPSSKITSTLLTASTMANLVGALTTHCAGSSLRLHSVSEFSDGLLSPTFYAVVHEVNN